MRIDMFVYNRCTTDARVLKEAATLAADGHDVRIVAVLDQTTPTAEAREGFRIVRIDRNPIHYRILKGVRWLSWIARRGAAETADRIETAEQEQRSSLSRLALAPLGLVIGLLKILWGPLAAALGASERVIRRALLYPHKPLMFFDYYRRAYKLVRGDPPDALHAHDLNTLPVAAALARRFDLPLTYDAHELYPEISTLSAREALVWRHVERRLAKHATAIVTVCESIAAEIETRNGVRRPIVLLNCPAAPAMADGKPCLLHNSLDLPEEEPIILYQGGFAPNRGLATLILSASQLERGTIVLMGWGALEDDLRRLIRDEGLERKVILTPPVPREEVIAHAAEAAVGLIPYEPVGLNNTYTTPNKLFDYMAAGLPVVASRLPELVRFVEDEGMGVTFKPGDPTDLAASVNLLLAEPDRYARMRGRALEMSRSYTWERESAKLLALYRDPAP